jgi:cell wall assembly regulator SMI1
MKSDDLPLSLEQIGKVEQQLGFALPESLKRSYLAANGGEPEPYVFENDDVDTVVSQFLPLVSPKRSTSVDIYSRLVLQKQIVDSRFFPFAVEGGGDYFFVDVLTPGGNVYFYRADSVPGDALLDLHMGLNEFWASLREE